MSQGRPRWLLLPLAAACVLTSLVLSHPPARAQQQVADGPSPHLAARLLPTAHPSVPATLDNMWYAGRLDAAPASGPLADLARGVRMLDQGEDPSTALPLVSNGGLATTDVADYARYYTGLALQRLDRLDDAEAQFAAVAAAEPEGYLGEAAGYRRAEIREAKADFAGAAAIYETLLARGVASPAIALVKLGAAASAAGDPARAIAAHRRVLREFPLAAEAAEAELLLDRLGGFALETEDAVHEELSRGETLFKAKKWAQARSAYERVASSLAGHDRDRVAVRLAQIDLATDRARQAREVFRRYLSHPTFAADAHFGEAMAARALKQDQEFVRLVEAAVARFPRHALAEEGLNELARHYVLTDEDGTAAAVYARLSQQFPSGPFAERAFWKAGWWAYRHDNYADAIRFFEQGAANFPRSDYRPAWLYWSARAYDGLGEREAASERFRLAATDYLNTYYGRLSWAHLERRGAAAVAPGLRRAIVAPPPPPPNVDRITRLIELELYAPALLELQHAAKMFGESAPLQATTALVQHKLGNLRPGINAMKRAYPQYMTAGGETLPVEVHRILFPLDYWPLIQEYSKKHRLDPYLIAALMGQESTFDAAIRSPANAIGLMQVMPATGRQYARKLGLGPLPEERLTDPVTNVTIGTQYFRDLLDRFDGKEHYVIASYNAGEHRVDRWRRERGELPQDEFIDDIPFPETQNYVKRILGTAEDYRRLYGPNGITPASTAKPTSAASAPRTPAKKTTAKASKRTPAKKPAAATKAPAKNTAKKTPAKKTPAKKAPRRR